MTVNRGDVVLVDYPFTVGKDTHCAGDGLAAWVRSDRPD
jgi:hypothetical protein